MGSDTPDYYFDTVAGARSAHMTITGPQPASLKQAMPNRRYAIRGTDIKFQFSELVVSGTVVEVRDGPAFAHRDDDTIYPVAFDDPAAVEHAFDVVMRVDEEFGATTGKDAVTFRVGAMNAEDLDAYKSSLQGLGDVIVFLQSRQDRDGTVWIPIEQGALIGLVSNSGELRFPGLGTDQAPKFTDEMSTMKQLRAAARERPQTTTLVAE
jgi:hypothetical protein